MPTTQEGAKSSGTPRLLSIGELAERSGVATTALRYYDELGLVRPATRSSGHRRYAESAVAEVGAILFFREVGFSLAEIGTFLTARDPRSRQEMVDRKLAELTEQQHRIEVAREALAHGQRCPRRRPHALLEILVDRRRTDTRAVIDGEPRASALTLRRRVVRRRSPGRVYVWLDEVAQRRTGAAAATRSARRCGCGRCRPLACRSPRGSSP